MFERVKAIIDWLLDRVVSRPLSDSSNSLETHVKPCPFCGCDKCQSHPYYKDRKFGFGFRIVCSRCGFPGLSAKTISEAEALWNEEVK